VQSNDQNISPARLRLLGILGMAGAPWMLIDFIENGLYDRFKNTSASGVHNLLFITGIMCSVLGLYYLKAAGTNKGGKIVMLIQLALLALANCWNIYEIISPDSSDRLFFILGLFWPASCMFLVITGIFIIRAKRLTGWRKVVPLLAGLWFPVMALLSIPFKSESIGFILAGLYAAIIFMALGFSLVTLPDNRLRSRRPI
jgi:hypothetical protein